MYGIDEVPTKPGWGPGGGSGNQEEVWGTRRKFGRHWRGGGGAGDEGAARGTARAADRAGGNELARAGGPPERRMWWMWYGEDENCQAQVVGVGAGARCRYELLVRTKKGEARRSEQSAEGEEGREGRGQKSEGEGGTVPRGGGTGVCSAGRRRSLRADHPAFFGGETWEFLQIAGADTSGASLGLVMFAHELRAELAAWLGHGAGAGTVESRERERD